ncbi:unnamed protein product [Cuscuta campestris]|uniref:Uncharacterized protein n=1 Tax=Cuscuta campestris TaxID=132261 RepID=A0A484MA79_9ASTE|nr:unnamed protein product [Cuscuta campestris]
MSLHSTESLQISITGLNIFKIQSNITQQQPLPNVGEDGMETWCDEVNDQLGKMKNQVGEDEEPGRRR